MSVDWYLEAPRVIDVFEMNFTYNYGPMIRRAELIDILYDGGGKKAEDVLPQLRAGLDRVVNNPEAYRALEPSNGWGSYNGFVEVLTEIVEACAKNPDAVVRISR